MSNLETTKGSIQHWPPAAAWASRVQLIGPHRLISHSLPLTLLEIMELWDPASPHPNPVGTTLLRKAESCKGYAAVETAGDSSYPSKRARVDTGTDALLPPPSGSDPFYRAAFRIECSPCRHLCLTTPSHC